jgi:hypothetical protein
MLLKSYGQEVEDALIQEKITVKQVEEIVDRILQEKSKIITEEKAIQEETQVVEPEQKSFIDIVNKYLK